MRPRSKLSGSTNLYPAQISEGGGLGEIYFFFFRTFWDEGSFQPVWNLWNQKNLVKMLKILIKVKTARLLKWVKVSKEKPKCCLGADQLKAPQLQDRSGTWYLKRDPVGGIKRATYQGGQIWRHPAIQTSCPDGECWWQPVLIQDVRLHC